MKEKSKTINNFLQHLSAFKNKPNNWQDDFEHENGNYVNNCTYCKKEFIGHKRRVVCKVCSEKFG